MYLKSIQDEEMHRVLLGVGFSLTPVIIKRRGRRREYLNNDLELHSDEGKFFVWSNILSFDYAMNKLPSHNRNCINISSESELFPLINLYT